MAQLAFTESADRSLAALEADAGREVLCRRVWDVLDALELDSSRADVRRRRYRSRVGVWGVPVQWREELWLVLWESGAPGSDEVIVLYVGPDL